MLDLQERLFRTVDRIADLAGFGKRRFSGEELIALAERRADGRALKDRSLIEPLDRLLKSYDEEANLSVFGRSAAKWDVLRCLLNLHRFEAEEEINPAILQGDITSPIFVTGLPRSGTTFLHTLLSLDPANRAPLAWQTIYPYPLGEKIIRDRRRARVAGQLRTFERLAPGIGNLHPFSADMPQECTEITAHVFQSLRFDTTHYVPSYQTWLDASGHEQPYRFHKRFLQHLQMQSGVGRWVLKCPDHVFTLDAIESVYPDARFVFVHRDPLSVLPSVAKLTEMIRRPFTRALDRLQIGRQISDRWLDGATRMMQASAETSERRSRIFHVHYRELIADPLPTLSFLYRSLGMELGAEAQTRMRDFIARTPRGGYGVNVYSFEEFGLEYSRLRECFGDYMRTFDIDRAQPAAGSAAPVAA